MVSALRILSTYLYLVLARALAGRGYGGLRPADGSRGRLLLQHCPVERVVVLVVQGAEQYPIKQLIIHTPTSVITNNQRTDHKTAHKRRAFESYYR